MMTSSPRVSSLVLCTLIVATVTIKTGDAEYIYVDRVERVERSAPVPDSENPASNPESTATYTTENPVTSEIPGNETIISKEVDNHDYYDVEYRNFTAENWIDVNTMESQWVVNQRLSTSDRHAVRVGLDFTFPFYGYDTSFLHITSSGFLYVGSYTHKYLAETQYVAPLMADFAPSTDDSSIISYYKNESIFATEWKNVHLKSMPDQNFTFQVVIHKNGTLVFSYKDIPVNVSSIHGDPPAHPVKVGLADAYYNDTAIWGGLFFKRVIFEYHSVDAKKSHVRSLTSIIFRPKETCTSRKTCSSCTTDPPDGFDCVWCSSLRRCSDGFDRNKQMWWMYGCISYNISDSSVCPPEPTQATTGSGSTDPPDSTSNAPTTATTTAPPVDICPELDCGPGTCQDNKCFCPDGFNGRLCQESVDGPPPVNQPRARTSHAGMVLFFLVLIVTIVIVAGWAIYGYKNPNTPSGLFLIKITRCYFCKKSNAAGLSYKYERTAESL